MCMPLPSFQIFPRLFARSMTVEHFARLAFYLTTNYLTTYKKQVLTNMRKQIVWLINSPLNFSTIVHVKTLFVSAYVYVIRNIKT